jgi:hypothetical protein
MTPYPRIALCVSGQTRSIDSCYKGWFNIFSKISNHIDVFCHFWDYNTIPQQANQILKKNKNQNLGLLTQPVPVTDIEKEQIITRLKPKKICFEKKQKLPENFYRVNHPISWWTVEQFKSMNKCALMKKDYEICNGIRYDIVYRIRSDLVLDLSEINNHKIVPETMYTVHNAFDKDFNTFRISDIFFYSDSNTYDQIADFYKHQQYIDATHVVQKDKKIDFPPEIALYFYVKSIGINVESKSISPLIKRTLEYYKIKGYLDPYETL